MSTRRKLLSIAPLALVALLLAGCNPTPKDMAGTEPASPSGGTPLNAPTDSGTPLNAPTDSGTPRPSNTAQASGCFVEFYDSDDLSTSKDHFTLSKPGRYQNLAHLPGSRQDWTGEVGSMQVGPKATVTIWTDTGFSGQSLQLQSGSKHPALDPQPSSLQLSCRG